MSNATTSDWLTEPDKKALRNAQERAGRIATAFQDSVPTWLGGETLDQYRQRLIEKFKHLSPTWKNADVSRLSGKNLDIVEAQVYQDAEREAFQPSNVRDGELVERVEVQPLTGRRIHRFYGDPRVAFGPFLLPVRQTGRQVA